MAIRKWVRANIEARIRQRADMVNSDFVTDAEVTQYADAGFAEFYGRIISQFEDLCVVMGGSTIQINATDTLYELPHRILKLKGLRHVGDFFLTPVSNVMEIEPFTTGGRTGKPTHYWLGGTGLGSSTLDGPMRWQPLPKANAIYNLDVYYVPNIDLDDVADADAGGSDDDGTRLGHLAWADEYVVLCGAIKCKDKEESDCTVLMAERKQLWDIIERSITPMDESMPKRMIQFQQARQSSFYQDPFDAELEFG